jgi:hypothetical protein
MSNPFRPDTSGDSPAYRLGRPGRHMAAYRDVSDAALAVLQEWHDEATAARKAAAERKAALDAAVDSPEAEQARAAMRARF